MPTRNTKEERQEEANINDAYAFEAKARAGIPKDSPAECGYVPCPMDEVTPALSDCDVMNRDHAWWLEREDAYKIKKGGPS